MIDWFSGLCRIGPMAAKKSGKKSGKKAGKKSGKKAGKKKKRGRTGPGSPLSVESEGGYSGVEDTVPTFSSTVSSEHTAGGEGKSSSPLLLVGLGGIVAVVLIFFLFKGGKKEQAPSQPSENAQISQPQGTPTAAPAQFKVVAGVNTLAKIAEKQLGSKDRWKEILDLNKSRIEDVKKLPGNTGIKLETLGENDAIGAGRVLLIPAK